MEQILNSGKYLSLTTQIKDRKVFLTFLLRQEWERKYVVAPTFDFNYELSKDRELNDLYSQLDYLVIGGCG